MKMHLRVAVEDLSGGNQLRSLKQSSQYRDLREVGLARNFWSGSWKLFSLSIIWCYWEVWEDSKGIFKTKRHTFYEKWSNENYIFLLIHVVCIENQCWKNFDAFLCRLADERDGKYTQGRLPQFNRTKAFSVFVSREKWRNFSYSLVKLIFKTTA